ncbi:MAG: ABC transporter permease [Alphaproteobacteria bacterium]|nr:ABC transporter permease [Alphaproteobacteria bacterium]
MIRLVRDSFRNLVGNKQRSLLALLGIVIGTASVIAMVNIGSIVRNEALRQFEAMGTDLVTISMQSASDPRGLSEREVDELAARVPGIATATAYGSRTLEMTPDGRTQIWASMIGSTSQFMRVAEVAVVRGRALSALDGPELYAIAGEELVRQWRRAGLELGPGSKIDGPDGSIVTIVGILGTASFNPLLGLDLNKSLLLSAAAFARLMPESVLASVAIRAADEADPREVARATEARLRATYPGQTIQARSAEQLIEQMANQMRLYTLLLGAIGGISLVVGGVGVMNVMLVAVTERRREIGIRMAIGARRRSIVSMFLTEAICLSLTGGLIGTLIGIGTAHTASSLAGWTFQLAPSAIPFGAGVSAAVGIVFGYLPARQASRVDPIQALRYE